MRFLEVPSAKVAKGVKLHAITLFSGGRLTNLGGPGPSKGFRVWKLWQKGRFALRRAVADGPTLFNCYLRAARSGPNCRSRNCVFSTERGFPQTVPKTGNRV